MAWPSYARILRENYSETLNQPARRTQMDSGSIAQKIRNSRPWKTRSFTFLVDDDRLSAFQAWMKSTGTSAFDFRDADGTTREVSVVGGAESIQIQAVALRVIDGGKRYRRGSVTLEGYG